MISSDQIVYDIASYLLSQKLKHSISKEQNQLIFCIDICYENIQQQPKKKQKTLQPPKKKQKTLQLPKKKQTKKIQNIQQQKQPEKELEKIQNIQQQKQPEKLQNIIPEKEPQKEPEKIQNIHVEIPILEEEINLYE